MISYLEWPVWLQDREGCQPEVLREETTRVAAVLNILLVILIGGGGNLLTLLAILHCRLRHRTRLRLETESIVKTLWQEGRHRKYIYYGWNHYIADSSACNIDLFSAWKATLMPLWSQLIRAKYLDGCWLDHSAGLKRAGSISSIYYRDFSNWLIVQQNSRATFISVAFCR